MKRFALLASTVLLAACATTQPDSLITPPDVGLVPGAAADPQVVEAPPPIPAKNPALAAFFEEVDLETVVENQQLKPGAVVDSWEENLLHRFTLGQELGNISKNRFFFIQNSSSQLYQNCLIWFLPNIALAGLIRCRARQNLCLSLNFPIYIDPKGRFCIVEKLHTQLGSAQWQERMDQYLPPVLEWLRWLREEQVTPSNFRPEYVHFNKEGELIAVKLMKPLPYHAGAVAAFIKKITTNERIIKEFAT